MCEIEDVLRSYTQDLTQFTIIMSRRGKTHQWCAEKVADLRVAGIDPRDYTIVYDLIRSWPNFTKEEEEQFIEVLEPGLQAACQYILKEEYVV